MKKEIIVLIVIFFIALGSRLFIAFQDSEFSDDESYFALRQIENIKDTGKLIDYDELSYGGKKQIDSPFFYYFLTFFSFFMPLKLVGKIIPNVLASLLVFFFFFITRYLTNNNKISLLTAFISGFIPIYFSRTVNSISVFSLVAPLIIFIIYCLLRIDDKKFFNYLVVSIFVLSFTSSSSFLLIIALLFYLLFLKLEKLRLSRKEIELVLFSTFLIVIVNFWIYKDAFLFHGASLIWQNFPKEMMEKYFLEFNLLGALYLIGIVPFVSGIYMIYYNLQKKKNKFTYLLISFAISAGLLLWFELIRLRIGLMFLGIILVLLFAQFMKKFWIYLDRTKFSKYKNYALLGILLIFVLTSVYPSYTYANIEMKKNPGKDEISALAWLKQKDGKVLGLLDEGNLITYYSGKENVWDSNFLMIGSIDQIEKDVKYMFTTISETKGIELLKKYNIKYIFYGKVRRMYGKIPYVNEKCFNIVYENSSVRVYELLCEIK